VQPLGEPTGEDRDLAACFAAARAEMPAFVEQLAFHRALEALWRAIDAANKYIVTTAPFTLAKDPASLPRAGAVLRNLLEGLAVTAVLLKPFLPETADRILAMLDLPLDAAVVAWGSALPDGHVTHKPEMLFPRIETD
jgi:methionyl-tRNA synthetase